MFPSALIAEGFFLVLHIWRKPSHLRSVDKKDYQDIFTAWARDYIQDRKQRIRSRKLKSTGNLLNNMDFDLIDDGDGVFRLVIFREFYGAFFNIRNIRPALPGRPYVERLTDWILKKKASFTMPRSGRSVDTKEDATQVAFAIARSRNRKPWKRRQWNDQPINKELETLTVRIADKTLELTIEQIDENLNLSNAIR